MQSIEFHTTIKQGVIAVPPEHLALLSDAGGATVIVVPDAQPAAQTPWKTIGLTEMVSSQETGAASSGGLRRHFGAVHGGDPRAADNDRIDADLARAYEHLHE